MTQPAGRLLDPLLGAESWSLQDGFKLCGVSLYSPLSYHEAEESAGADSESTFRGVQFHAILYEDVECLLEMCSMIQVLLGLHQHVININFQGAAE